MKGRITTERGWSPYETRTPGRGEDCGSKRKGYHSEGEDSPREGRTPGEVGGSWEKETGSPAPAEGVPVAGKRQRGKGKTKHHNKQQLVVRAEGKQKPSNEEVC